MKRGITGFWASIDKPPTEHTEAELNTVVHTIAHLTNSRLLKEYEAPTTVSTYRVYTLERNGQMYYVCLHQFEYVCVVASYVAPHQVQWIDDPLVQQVIDSLPRWEYWTVEQLERPMKDDWLQPLSKVEREQVNYWKPTTIGELLFNDWD